MHTVDGHQRSENNPKNKLPFAKFLGVLKNVVPGVLPIGKKQIVVLGMWCPCWATNSRNTSNIGGQQFLPLPLLKYGEWMRAVLFLSHQAVG